MQSILRYVTTAITECSHPTTPVTRLQSRLSERALRVRVKFGHGKKNGTARKLSRRHQWALESGVLRQVSHYLTATTLHSLPPPPRCHLSPRSSPQSRAEQTPGPISLRRSDFFLRWGAAAAMRSSHARSVLLPLVLLLWLGNAAAQKAPSWKTLSGTFLLTLFAPLAIPALFSMICVDSPPWSSTTTPPFPFVVLDQVL